MSYDHNLKSLRKWSVLLWPYGTFNQNKTFLNAHACIQICLIDGIVCCIEHYKVQKFNMSVCVYIFNEILQPSFLHKGNQQALSMRSVLELGLVHGGDEKLMLSICGRIYFPKIAASVFIPFHMLLQCDIDTPLISGSGLSSLP